MWQTCDQWQREQIQQHSQSSIWEVIHNNAPSLSFLFSLSQCSSDLSSDCLSLMFHSLWTPCCGSRSWTMTNCQLMTSLERQSLTLRTVSSVAIAQDVECRANMRCELCTIMLSFERNSMNQYWVIMLRYEPSNHLAWTVLQVWLQPMERLFATYCNSGEIMQGSGSPNARLQAGQCVPLWQNILCTSRNWEWRWYELTHIWLCNPVHIWNHS